MLSTALLLAMSMVMGQAEKADQPTQKVATNEHLKVLEPLIGTWLHKHPAGIDWESVGVKTGDPLITRAVYSWVANGNGIQLVRTEELPSGKLIFERRRELIAWNAETKQIVSFRIGPRGRSAHCKWKQEGEDWIMECDFVETTGERESKEQRITVRDGKLLRHVGPDWPSREFTKVK